MKYIVVRDNGRGTWVWDALVYWDIIWGPAWSAVKGAIRFSSLLEAEEAANTAKACLKPVPWIVPDYCTASNVKVMEVSE